MADFKELEVNELNIPKEGKHGVIFHIPGHCAGCKRVVDNLKKRPCDGWNFTLVNAEDDNFKNLVSAFSIQSAPTVILYNNGSITDTIIGLKDFLSKADVLFGPLSH